MTFLHSRNQGGVTYTFSGGRFGDNLLAYLHAKWISYQEKIPLLYKPFGYSSYLVLDEKEMTYESSRHFFTHTIEYSQSLRLGIERIKTRNFLYSVPYFPEDKEEQLTYSFFHFDVDWKNTEFRTIVKELLAPKRPLATIEVPQNCISIALHVREGGGFDTDHTRYYAPKKLPPLHFYIDGLLKMLEYFKGKSIYCHVFTDAVNPESIIENIRAGIKNNHSIVFAYRKENNHHDSNILEDFFSFFKFDAMIRPQSNFSIIPSLLKDYAILIHPKTAIIKYGSPFIDQLEIVIQDELYQKLMNDCSSNFN